MATKRFNWEFDQIRGVFSQDPLDSKDELCFMDGCYNAACFTMASALGEIGGSMILLVCGSCARKLRKAKWGRRN